MPLGVSSPFTAETRTIQHVAQRIAPFPRNEDVVDRDVFAPLVHLLPASIDYQSAAPCGTAGSEYVCRLARFHLPTEIVRHRSEDAYRQVRDPACTICCVHADNETPYTHDYKMVGKRLGPSGSLDGSDLLMALREWVHANQWLLVLKAEDVKFIVFM